MTCDPSRSRFPALGAAELPATVLIEEQPYRLLSVIKHDFHGATAIYGSDNGRAIVKLGRKASLFGLPMAWLGRWLMGRERRIYDVMGPLQGVPRYLGPVGGNGLAHDYIEGRPHRRNAPGLGAEFFVELDGLLRKIHDQDLAYLDLSKPENILVGDDGRPYLIDFGIAWHCPEDRRQRRGIWRWLPATFGTAVLREFQRADRFHLLKHWRRNEPESMSEEDHAASRERQGWTRIHGWFRVPYRALRRWLRGGASGRI